MNDLSCAEETTIQPQAWVDMTQDEIQRLLCEAENRLRTPSSMAVELKSQPENNSQNVTLSIPKLDQSLQPYVRERDNVATIETRQKYVATFDPLEPKASIAPNKKIHVFQVSNQRLTNYDKKDKPTAGEEWFNLPKTEMTPEFKRDLQLLRMRSVLDPKRHYKKESGKAKPPEFSQVGTIIEGPTEFFSARIAKKDRKKTFVEEAMASERETRRFESKYNDIQSTKRSGKKAYYKDLRSKRGHKNK